MSRRAEDDGFSLRDDLLEHAARRVVRAEIDDHVAALHCGGEIVSEVDRCGDGDAHFPGGGDEGLTHAALAAVDDDAEGHVSPVSPAPSRGPSHSRWSCRTAASA